MRIPKVSKVHQGFAGTFTRMDDGNDGGEREERFMMCYKKNIQNSSGLNVTNRQNDTEQEDGKSGLKKAYISKTKNLGLEM